MVIFVITNLVFLFTIVEGRNISSSFSSNLNLTLSANTITEDEIIFSEYLNSQNVSGIIFTNSFIISRRIGGYGFLPTVLGRHFPQVLYYDWLDYDYVLKHSTFSAIIFIQHLRIHYTRVDFEDQLINQIKFLNITDEDDLLYLINLNIQFLVCLVEDNNEIINYIISPFGDIYYHFFKSLNNLEPDISVGKLSLWMLY
ncbi:MAG: hypothetical protein ACTSP3_00825 [Candidatus Heimdallarchaeaceae archaeon]